MKSQRLRHFMVPLKLGKCFKRDLLRTAALVVFGSANVATVHDDDLLVFRSSNAHLRAKTKCAKECSAAVYLSRPSRPVQTQLS